MLTVLNEEKWMGSDQEYMERALSLALEGMGRVSPNPMVGAVLVKEGRIIGEGFHRYHGGPHGEVNAIDNATESVEGATLYSNLEPCCHENKLTPPCVNLIVEKKIGRVVISNRDPNPQVAGKGLQKLAEAGIEVTEGVLESKGAVLNEIFFKFIATRKPFVHIKMAQTLDGKLCDEKKTTQWISGEKSRRHVHLLRKQYDAVLVGSGTYNRDNPLLTCRSEDVVEKQQPFRIVVGNPRRMNLDFNLFNDEYRDKTIVASTAEVKDIPKELADLKIIEVGSKKDPSFWHQFWKQLGAMKISSVLVEGGPAIVNSILQEGQWDKLTTFVTPIIFGNGPDFFQSKKSFALQRPTVELYGMDVSMSGYRV